MSFRKPRMSRRMKVYYMKPRQARLYNNTVLLYGVKPTNRDRTIVLIAVVNKGFSPNPLYFTI